MSSAWDGHLSHQKGQLSTQGIVKLSSSTVCKCIKRKADCSTCCAALACSALLLLTGAGRQWAGGALELSGLCSNLHSPAAAGCCRAEPSGVWCCVLYLGLCNSVMCAWSAQQLVLVASEVAVVIAPTLKHLMI